MMSDRALTDEEIKELQDILFGTKSKLRNLDKEIESFTGGAVHILTDNLLNLMTNFHKHPDYGVTADDMPKLGNLLSAFNRYLYKLRKGATGEGGPSRPHRLQDIAMSQALSIENLVRSHDNGDVPLVADNGRKIMSELGLPMGLCGHFEKNFAIDQLTTKLLMLNGLVKARQTNVKVVELNERNAVSLQNDGIQNPGIQF